SDARRLLAGAHTLAEELGDASLRIRATFGLAAVQGDYQGEFDEAVEGLRHAIAIADETEDRALRVEGHLRLGFHFFNMGEIALAEEELLQCVELAGELGSLRDEARAAFLLGPVNYYSRDSDQANR